MRPILMNICSLYIVKDKTHYKNRFNASYSRFVRR